MELTQNVVSGRELGALMQQDSKSDWFVVFEFEEAGYIKDDEKDKLDAEAILDSLKKGTEKANEVRKERGWPAFHVIGWEKKPSYHITTNNLFWAIRGKGDAGGQSINHSVRILGRRGTMNVDLVASPEEYSGIVPVFDQVMGGFSYTQGHRYADYVTGDKVASYGLTALVVGGVGAVALKTGLFQKLWKPILIALVAAIGALRKFFARLFGRKAENQPPIAPGT